MGRLLLAAYNSFGILWAFLPLGLLESTLLLRGS